MHEALETANENNGYGVAITIYSNENQLVAERPALLPAVSVTELFGRRFASMFDSIQLDEPTHTELAPTALRQFIARQFKDLVCNPLFPCTIARGTAAQDNLDIQVYDDLDSLGTATALLEDLYRFIAEHPLGPAGYNSFAAVFTSPVATSEAQYEQSFWMLLQRLHDLDRPLHVWDASVAADPASGEFSFSLGERAFFMVGMHPGASRHARRFAYPVIVFNTHAQFEALRCKGVYQTVRDKIRGNDVTLQGSINPALEDHGKSSEARQYSGRKVEPDWACPFHSRAA